MSARASLLLTTAILALVAIAVIGGRATAAVSPDPCPNSSVPGTRLTDEQYAAAITCTRHR